MLILFMLLKCLSAFDGDETQSKNYSSEKRADKKKREEGGGGGGERQRIRKKNHFVYCLEDCRLDWLKFCGNWCYSSLSFFWTCKIGSILRKMYLRKFC